MKELVDKRLIPRKGYRDEIQENVVKPYVVMLKTANYSPPTSCVLATDFGQPPLGTTAAPAAPAASASGVPLRFRVYLVMYMFKLFKPF